MRNWTTLAGIAAAALLGSACAMMAPPPPPAPPVEEEPGIAQGMPPAEQPRLRVLTREPEIVEVWPRLLTERADHSAAAEVFGEEGLTPPEVEAVLDHLVLGGLYRDPAFERAARRVLQRELAEFVLDREARRRAVPPAEEEVRAEYDRRIAEFTSPATATIRILLTASATQARELEERARSGEDFGNLARQFSEHPSRNDGGALPPFPKGTYTAQLEEVAFALAPGEIGLAETSRGVFVVQKIASSEPVVRPFSEVRARLRMELEEQRLAAARAALIEDWTDRP